MTYPTERSLRDAFAKLVGRDVPVGPTMNGAIDFDRLIDDITDCLAIVIDEAHGSLAWLELSMRERIEQFSRKLEVGEDAKALLMADHFKNVALKEVRGLLADAASDLVGFFEEQKDRCCG